MSGNLSAIKLAKENKSVDTVAALQEAIKAYPDYFEAHLLLGGEYLKMERLNDAIAEFEQARKINPKDDRVYRGFGQVLMMRKYMRWPPGFSARPRD